MIDGIALLLCTLIPLIAGLSGLIARPSKAVSLGAAMMTFTAGLVVAVITIMPPGRGTYFRSTPRAWETSDGHAPPTLLMTLPRNWALVPALLAAAVALVVVRAPADRHALLHVAHASMQGAASAGVPEFGLAFVSLGTAAAAVELAAASRPDGSHGMSVASRWVFADLAIWAWSLGVLGDGGGATTAAILALAVRASVFPFHGGLLRSLRGGATEGLLLALLAPSLWAYRWVERGMLGDSPLTACFLVTAALVPAALSLSDKNAPASAAYRLVAVVTWPLVLNASTSLSVATVALGCSVALGRQQGLSSRVSAGVAVLAPSIAISSSPGPISTAQFVGWGTVSLAALLIGSPRPGALPENAPNSKALEGLLHFVLTLVALTAFGDYLVTRSVGPNQ